MKNPGWKRLAVGVVLVLAVFAVGRFSAGEKEQGGVDAERSGMDGMKSHEASVKKWTCSMHPQIQLDKPGKCPICGMTLIPLESGAATAGMREVSISKDAAELLKVETAPVERRFVTANIRMVGKVAYDETRVTYITAWVPGRLDRLFVDYTGLPVKKGEHMVSLYSPELISAQEELLQAIAATRSMSQSKVDVVREATDETVVAAREKLRLWGLTEAQIKKIEKSGKVEDQMTIYAPASGIVVHKNAQEGMYVKTGTRIYTIADLSQVWINLDAYESDLEWIRYGQQVKFEVEALPGETFAGRISFIQPVLDEKSRTVKVRVNVPNTDGRLKPGMFVKAVVSSKLAEGGRVMDATLAGKWICPMHPGVVKDAPGNCDICGMALVTAKSLGYAAATGGDVEKPLVIPVSAALLTGTRAVVYVRIPGRESPTFEGREIVLGPRAGDFYEVKAGLDEGERIVVNGAFMLDAELQIKAKPSMMTPQGGGGGGMAGMNHGGKKMSAKDMSKMKSDSLKLSDAAVKKLRQIAMLGDKALKALNGDDLKAIHAAFENLGDELYAVEITLPKGKAVTLWKEHNMLLGNDAVEGQGVDFDRASLKRELAAHLKAMRKAYGIDMSGMAGMSGVAGGGNGR